MPHVPDIHGYNRLRIYCAVWGGASGRSAAASVATWRRPSHCTSATAEFLVLIALTHAIYYFNLALTRQLTRQFDGSIYVLGCPHALQRCRHVSSTRCVITVELALLAC